MCVCYIYTYICIHTQEGDGAPSGVRTLFSACNSVGTPEVRMGAPTHAFPHGSRVFKASFTKFQNLRWGHKVTNPLAQSTMELRIQDYPKSKLGRAVKSSKL